MDQREKTLDSFYDALYSTIQSISTNTRVDLKTQKVEGVNLLKTITSTIVAIEVASFLEIEPIKLDLEAGDSLPEEFPEGTRIVFLGLDLAEDLDISTWKPTGLENNSIVQLKKITSNVGKIKYVDGHNLKYNFVDRVGEFITLIYSKEANKFIVY